MDIEVKFYSAFRKHGDQIILSLPAGSRIADVKDVLAHKLSAPLVHDCAFACNDAIVDAERRIAAGDVVSVLPPVCGG